MVVTSDGMVFGPPEVAPRPRVKGPLVLLLVGLGIGAFEWLIRDDPGHLVVFQVLYHPGWTTIGVLALWGAAALLIRPRRSLSAAIGGVCLVLADLGLLLGGLVTAFFADYGDYPGGESTSAGSELRVRVEQASSFGPGRLYATVSARADRGPASREAELVTVRIDLSPAAVRIADDGTIVVVQCTQQTTFVLDPETLDVRETRTEPRRRSDPLPDDGVRVPVDEPGRHHCTCP